MSKNDDFAAFAGQHAANPPATNGNGNGEYYDEYDDGEMDFEPQNGYHEEDIHVEEAPAKKARVKDSER